MNNYKYLYNLYWIENLSLRQIAKKSNRSHEYIRKILKQWGIPIKNHCQDKRTQTLKSYKLK